MGHGYAPSRNIVCAAYDRIDVREGLENAIGYGNSLVAYAVGVLRGDNLAAAFFKCLLVTSYTSLRGGLALDIRQNNNLTALTDLLGYILAALVSSVLVRRADKGFRLIENWCRSPAPGS